MVQEPNRETEVVRESNTQARECLLVMLQRQIVLAKIRPWPLGAFACEGRRYQDAGFGEWTEFYDWLRDSDSNVLGVCYWLRSDTEFLAELARDRPYIETDPTRYLEIYFSERHGADPTRSCDQDFLYDGIFRSDEGEYAIGFGMGGLNESDSLSLQNTGAKWAEAHRLE